MISQFCIFSQQYQSSSPNNINPRPSRSVFILIKEMKTSIKFLLIALALFAFLAQADSHLQTEAPKETKEKSEGKEAKEVKGSVLLVEIKKSGLRYGAEKKEEKSEKSASGSESSKDSATGNKAAQVRTVIPIVPIVPRPAFLTPEHKFFVPIASKAGSSADSKSDKHAHDDNCTDVNETAGNDSSVSIDTTNSSVINIEITIGSHHDNDGKKSAAAENKYHDKGIEASIRNVLAAPVVFKSTSDAKKDDKKADDKKTEEKKEDVKPEADKDQK